MQIDYALILGAGLGTRMGEIGKVIPKVLWPIYFKTMLELQIRYCEDLGIKKIYLNTHFLHEEIITFLNNSKFGTKITVLHEEVLLDSGGAIHNFASRAEINYQGNLLLVNGDQFLFFDQKFWDEAINRIDSSRAVLFGIRVDKKSAYNETIVENHRLINIQKNSQKKGDYTTYSGLGVLNLNGLRPVTGISRFFETVVDYKNEKIDFLTPDCFEYWDFGTADIYAKNIFKIYNEQESLMNNFLKKSSAYLGEKKTFIDYNLHSIDLDFKGNFTANSINFRGIQQKI